MTRQGAILASFGISMRLFHRVPRAHDGVFAAYDMVCCFIEDAESQAADETSPQNPQGTEPIQPKMCDSLVHVQDSKMSAVHRQYPHGPKEEFAEAHKPRIACQEGIRVRHDVFHLMAHADSAPSSSSADRNIEPDVYVSTGPILNSHAARVNENRDYAPRPDIDHMRVYGIDCIDEHCDACLPWDAKSPQAKTTGASIVLALAC